MGAPTESRESQLRWNRAGRLSPSQRLALAAGRPARWACTLSLLAVAGWLLGAQLRVERAVPALAVLVLAALAGSVAVGTPWLRRLRDAAAGVAAGVEGEVVSGTESGVLGRRRVLSVGGRRLEAPSAGIPPGHLRVYFAPRSRTVLAIEPPDRTPGTG